MHAIIMAGGKGTRLSSITNDEIPKPMVQIYGKPILQWQLECLKNNHIFDVIIVTGHLGDKIEQFFGDGHSLGMKISYIKEQHPLGTAGAFYYLKEILTDEYFLLVFGDVIFDVDIQRIENYHLLKKAAATLFVHPNTHPFDSDLVATDKNERIIRFDSKNNKRDYWYNNCVNAGFYILSREICCSVLEPIKTDLEKDILMPLAENGGDIYAYSSSEYIKDVGTPERLIKAEKELSSGYVASRNLKNKQKCIFMDRDGTLNKYDGLIYKEEQLILGEYATEAIKKINESGYLAIVITNQPVVARGLCELEDVDNINNKMKTILGLSGALLDEVIYCPHHPDKGFPEENPLFKIDCDCRKPKTGMIDSCVERFNIDRTLSWMIGDTSIDIQTGINAGLKTVLVMTGEAGKDKKYNVKPDMVCKNLLEAVDYILKEGV